MAETIASLTRMKSVRVFDVSAGGCLFESREYLPVGMVGLLSMDFDGRVRQEWIRINRIHAGDGQRGRCLVSAEFLPLGPASLHSLRGAVMRLGAVRSSRPRIPLLSGRSSGDPGKSARPSDVRDDMAGAARPVNHADLDSLCNAPHLATPLLNRFDTGVPKPEREKE